MTTNGASPRPSASREDQIEAIRSRHELEALNIKTTQIPVRMMVLAKELRLLGLNPGDVIERKKVYVKGRAQSVFRHGPRIDDALRRTGDLFVKVS